MIHDPEGWEAASEQARAARAHVAAQVAEALITVEHAGSRDLMAQRLRDVLRAEQTGDQTLLRAAVMEVSIASAAYAATLDLRSGGTAR